MTVKAEKLLGIAHEAVDIARDLLLSTDPGDITPKGDRDFSSELDSRIETAIRAFLAARTPDIGFLGEENGHSGPTVALDWVLDPIDGTVNFVRGMPLCGVSLALVREQHPIAGVIDLPFLNSRYHGALGQGSYRGDRRLQVRPAPDLSSAVVAIGDYAVGAGATQKNERRLRLTERLAERALRVRMLGSAAMDLAWVAEGHLNASIALSNNPWDMAAGVVIAREAGAAVVDGNGVEHSLASRATIAAHSGLIPELLALLASTDRLG